MNDKRSESNTATTASHLLTELGHVMRTCYNETLEIQDLLSRAAAGEKTCAAYHESYQNLDRVTQIQDDIARLLPALGNSLSGRDAQVDHLSATLTLISLRERLFQTANLHAPITTTKPGEVDLF